MHRHAQQAKHAGHVNRPNDFSSKEDQAMNAITPGSRVRIRGCGLVGNVLEALDADRYAVVIPILGGVFRAPAASLTPLDNATHSLYGRRMRRIEHDAMAYLEQTRNRSYADCAQ